MIITWTTSLISLKCIISVFSLCSSAVSYHYPTPDTINDSTDYSAPLLSGPDNIFTRLLPRYNEQTDSSVKVFFGYQLFFPFPISPNWIGLSLCI